MATTMALTMEMVITTVAIIMAATITAAAATETATAETITVATLAAAELVRTGLVTETTYLRKADLCNTECATVSTAEVTL